MEFYKVVKQQNRYVLEEENGQDGEVISQQMLAEATAKMQEFYLHPEGIPLTFRKYITVYYSSGTMEYVAMADAAKIPELAPMDGFAATWLEGEEENRVWIGADGAVENRGPSTEKVKWVLEQLLENWNELQGEKA